MTTLDISQLRLDIGKHDKLEDGGCAMEWVSAFAGLPWSDSPSCTDPVVASYVRTLNDVMPDRQRQRLIPYISLLATTSNGVPQQTRAFIAADFAIHVFAPIGLRASGFEDHAVQLEGLAKVENIEAANAAVNAATYAANAANADYAFAAANAAANAANAAAAAAYADYAAANAAYAAYAAANAAYAAANAANAAANAANAAANVWDRALELLDLLLAAPGGGP